MTPDSLPRTYLYWLIILGLIIVLALLILLINLSVL